MKVIDVFIFNSYHETNLLFAKLVCESPVVDQFIGVDCKYTYRGEEKGFSLEEIIQTYGDFRPFREKVKIINIEANLAEVESHTLDYIVDPIPYAKAEVRLREFPTDYILENFSDNDYVLVTDVDELFDLTDKNRRDSFIKFLSFGDPLQFDRIRYTYDWNNRSLRARGDCITPAYKVKHLKDGTAKLSDKKWVGKLVDIQPNPIVFEYCSCFSYPGLLYKYNSSLHTKWVKDKIDLSLKTNTWTRTEYQEMDKNNRYLWFDTVELTEKNSPEYVREFFNELTTGIVAENYRENRVKYYGLDPFPEEKCL